MQSHAPTLESLVQRESLSDADRAWLLELLSKETSLTVSRASPEGLSALCGSLSSSSTLRHLDLGSNHIGAEEVRHVADALRVNSTLRHLDLGDNFIGPEGARHLAEALRGNSTLRHLDLGGNDIGAEGARHVAVALRDNSTLLHLDIGGNGIGSEGLRHLTVAARLRSQPLVIDGRPELKPYNDRARRIIIAQRRLRRLARLWAVARVHARRGRGV